MWYRRISLIAALLILAGGFGINKWLAAQKTEPPRKSAERGSVKVQVSAVQNGAVQAEVPITGRLRARQKIELFAEVSGRLERGDKPFQEGVFFQQGEVLLRLEHRDQELQLIAQRSAFHSQILRLIPDLKIDYASEAPAWEQYVQRFDAARPLPNLPELSSDKARNFLALNQIFNQYYSITAAEALLAKYTIRAPFNGVISSGKLDPGNLIRVGTRLGEFLSPGRYELEASIAQTDLAYVKAGQSVELSEGPGQATHTGIIERISPVLDAGTQTVKVYVQVSGQGLREGLYLSGMILGSSVDDAYAIDRSLLRDDGSVWVVQDEALLPRQTEHLFSFGQKVAVRGLNNGDQLVVQRLAGAYAGMPVRLD